MITFIKAIIFLVGLAILVGGCSLIDWEDDFDTDDFMFLFFAFIVGGTMIAAALFV